MTSEWEARREEWHLPDLHRQYQVLGAFEELLKCDSRGLCLLHEYLRRYGQPGSGCRCFGRITEWLLERDLPDY